MIRDPSTEMPGSVVNMAGAPQAAAPRPATQAFDDPAHQRRRLALFNEIKEYARGQNYPGVSDGEISQMAADASHKLDAMSGADKASFVARGDTSVATLVQSTFANFLNSKTAREREAMRQPPASAATSGTDQAKDKSGIDPLTGLLGVERRGLGGMYAANTAGTNIASGNSGNAGTSGTSSAAYGAINNHDYGSPGYWASTKGMAETRSFAVQNGVPWVASNPQLLRLGVPAVKILSDAHLTKENYNVLHKGIGLSDKASVGIVKIFNEKGEDANKRIPQMQQDYNAINRVAPEAARILKEDTEELGQASLANDPVRLEKARKRMHKHVDEQSRRHPKAAPHMRRYESGLAAKAKATNEAHKRADATASQAQASEARAASSETRATTSEIRADAAAASAKSKLALLKASGAHAGK